ncbi:hypothetical protein RHS04_08396 [Rhizoctonia solani]|uniref:Uncharacterized protein n=1 Tax=Rhizoctonia solani TaxID=456999 RepID=A0A8H7H1A0_9AGAM|nr:hypothetical protein RHS04_08396 [Rhizoctonia solani]
MSLPFVFTLYPMLLPLAPHIPLFRLTFHLASTTGPGRYMSTQVQRASSNLSLDTVAPRRRSIASNNSGRSAVGPGLANDHHRHHHHYHDDPSSPVRLLARPESLSLGEATFGSTTRTVSPGYRPPVHFRDVREF